MIKLYTKLVSLYFNASLCNHYHMWSHEADYVLSFFNDWCHPIQVPIILHQIIQLLSNTWSESIFNTSFTCRCKKFWLRAQTQTWEQLESGLLTGVFSGARLWCQMPPDGTHLRSFWATKDSRLQNKRSENATRSRRRFCQFTWELKLMPYQKVWNLAQDMKIVLTAMNKS